MTCKAKGHVATELAEGICGLVISSLASLFAFAEEEGQLQSKHLDSKIPSGKGLKRKCAHLYLDDKL